jgi:DNA-directed RNA polymerase specialized sigma24 family protein
LRILSWHPLQQRREIWCRELARTGSISDDEREYLEAIARRYSSPYREVVRARIVLYAAEGLSNDTIAARLDTPRQVVSKWRQRFFEKRLAGLQDEPRGGRPPVFPP